MRLLALTLAAGLFAGQAAAQTAVPGFGQFTPPEAAHERPSPTRTYKVAFEVNRASPDPAQINAGLDRVARFVNLLAAGGVPASQRKVVAVIDGMAVDAVLTDTAYGRRHNGAKNPNAPLIAALRAGGAEVHVCSFSMASQKVTIPDVLPDVQVDAAAMLTLATLQLDGYAFIGS